MGPRPAQADEKRLLSLEAHPSPLVIPTGA